MTMVLDGIRVLEAAHFVAGPAAGVIMADFGADVIHLEPPEIGDPMRGLYKIHPMPECEQNYPWLLDNRSKRSVALDLMHPGGREAFERLVRQSDVFLTNYLPKPLEGLRLRYEDLKPLNERLIYAHLTGYGEVGPHAGRPGYDVTAWWARSGLADLTRPKGGEVASPPIATGDHATSLALFGAIMTALYRRERTGEGGKVATSLMASGVWNNALFTQADLCGGKPFERTIHSASANALVAVYRTKDDRYFYLMVVRDLEWQPFCEAIVRPDLLADPRFAGMADRERNHRELVVLLDDVFAHKTMAEWSAIFDRVGIAFGPVQQVNELQHDPQMRANQVFRKIENGNGLETVDSPIQLEGVPKRTPALAPELGEHTRQVLESLGYSATEITALVEAGAIGVIGD